MEIITENELMWSIQIYFNIVFKVVSIVSKCYFSWFFSPGILSDSRTESVTDDARHKAKANLNLNLNLNNTKQRTLEKIN